MNSIPSQSTRTKCSGSYPADSKRKGFTLIEAMVGIVMLVSTSVGVINIARGGIILGGLSREHLIAAYLAQEPIEVLRNLRDSNRAGWLTAIDPCVAPKVCRIDTSVMPPTITECVGGSCPQLQLNSIGRYGYGSGTARFIRNTTIQIPLPTNSDEGRVTVTMMWNDHGTTKTFVAESNLFK